VRAHVLHLTCVTRDRRVYYARERGGGGESSLDAPKYAPRVERALEEWRRCRAERDDLGRECAGGKGTRGDGERRERIEIELWLAA